MKRDGPDAEEIVDCSGERPMGLKKGAATMMIVGLAVAAATGFALWIYVPAPAGMGGGGEEIESSTCVLAFKISNDFVVRNMSFSDDGTYEGYEDISPYGATNFSLFLPALRYFGVNDPGVVGNPNYSFPPDDLTYDGVLRSLTTDEGYLSVGSIYPPSDPVFGETYAQHNISGSEVVTLPAFFAMIQVVPDSVEPNAFAPIYPAANIGEPTNSEVEGGFSYFSQWNESTTYELTRINVNGSDDYSTLSSVFSDPAHTKQVNAAWGFHLSTWTAGA